MIDLELKVYLIEVNKNPCLSTLSEPQSELISKLLEDTFRYELSKQNHNRPYIRAPDKT